MAGAFFQREPDWSTCMIPVITKRSYMRGMPRRLFGIAGLSGTHRSSLYEGGPAIPALRANAGLAHPQVTVWIRFMDLDLD